MITYILEYSMEIINFYWPSSVKVVGDEFLKIPYVKNGNKYYMLLKLNEEDERKNKILSLINGTNTDEDIYINSLLEFKLKLNDVENEIDITNEMEKYMGPDQLYLENKDKIRIIDLLPEKYHNRFEYLTTMDEMMEYKTYENLFDTFF